MDSTIHTKDYSMVLTFAESPDGGIGTADVSLSPACNPLAAVLALSQILTRVAGQAGITVDLSSPHTPHGSSPLSIPSQPDPGHA